MLWCSDFLVRVCGVDLVGEHNLLWQWECCSERVVARNSFLWQRGCCITIACCSERVVARNSFLWQRGCCITIAYPDSPVRERVFVGDGAPGTESGAPITESRESSPPCAARLHCVLHFQALNIHLILLVSFARLRASENSTLCENLRSKDLGGSPPLSV